MILSDFKMFRTIDDRFMGISFGCDTIAYYCYYCNSMLCNAIYSYHIYTTSGHAILCWTTHLYAMLFSFLYPILDITVWYLMTITWTSYALYQRNNTGTGKLLGPKNSNHSIDSSLDVEMTLWFLIHPWYCVYECVQFSWRNVVVSDDRSHFLSSPLLCACKSWRVVSACRVAPDYVTVWLWRC